MGTSGILKSTLGHLPVLVSLIGQCQATQAESLLPELGLEDFVNWSEVRILGDTTHREPVSSCPVAMILASVGKVT